ncbi:hypothetical protein FD29_GL000559 [Companilactobacillus mindensis DSM 14500]|jgi:hypothetical protein|uniref:Uncharacterized protein n=1 Tax=Companilactobacillus mindensis DSM 14500 TaxID=1423770 RepID=A0A0R1QVU8_9LACO|nr:hypothetical protein [Companilactobacillus mindensis]KRL45304.1 hypothetical protein FD29_GL000559 [Companilactobacillus mindensis DSM 14500]GEO79049.1 hypothetical protein LMI01_13800 [Companilactobacillus mindensis]
MNIFTTDIILFLLLISILNDPLLKMFQNLNLDFITSEILIGLILILILWLIHKLVLRKYIFKK